VEKSLGKTEAVMLLLLVLTSSVLIFSFSPQVKAGTEIISLTPTFGNVGTIVELTANINTSDGEYGLMFDEDELLSGSATGNSITASFNVPHTFEGNHTVMIVDTTTGENGTATFTVAPLHLVETDVPEPPAQRQEGDPVTIIVNITGAKSNHGYVANITVQPPSGNLTYESLKNITTTGAGDFYGNLSYPDDFSTDANTNFTGEYTITLNTTLADQTFFIGLTNSTEYHRFQNVDIKAVYNPSENVTLTITGEDVQYSENLTAKSDGIIHHTNWTVPSNAQIGIYTVNITSISPNATTKIPPDFQYFTVPGFDVNVTTRNLAGKPVANIALEAFEHGESLANETSDLDGLAIMKLEVGNYSCKAKYRGSEIGDFSMKIAEDTSLVFNCSLTSMRILVTDENGNRVPLVDVYVTPENQTFSTHDNGTAILYSLLPNLEYVLNASRYSMQFNTTTIQQLPLEDWFNITITCPDLTLRVNVADIHGQPLNVTVRVQELTSGLRYPKDTLNGKAILSCTFGRYIIKTYVGAILLNETYVDMFQNQNLSIICRLYGLTVSVRVVDYFGQPISNANVELQREGLAILPKRTESSGTATFPDLIGGSLGVSIYLADQTQPCVSAKYLIEETKTIEVRIGKYVVLAGFLVETSQLTTAIIIAAAVTLLVLIEVYMRRRRKLQKSSD
jgi:hypothetical protein